MSHPFESGVRAVSLGFALAALGTASAVHAQPPARVIYVDAAAPAGGDGQLWTSALRDVQDALFLASFRPDRTVPVQIRIAQGIYTPDSATLNRSASFIVNSAVSVLGGFAGLASANPGENDPSRFVTVLSGDLARNDAPGVSTRSDNSYLVLQIQSQPGQIDGVTIRGGLRALYRSGFGALRMSRCSIIDSVLPDPATGGVPSYYAGITLTETMLTECTIADNYSVASPILFASNCVFLRCRIAGNHYQNSPQGPSTQASMQINAPCDFDACLIAANSSSAANLSFVGPANNFFSTTFADNIAATGPALSRTSGNAVLFNCVFARNTSTAGPMHQIAGGGVALDSCLLEHGTSDIWNNGGFSTTTRIVTGDPRFINPAGIDGDPFSWRDNDYRLASGSPCIDRGTSFPTIYFSSHPDLLGQNPSDDPAAPNLGVGPIAYLDLGAYEYIPNPCPADFNRSGTLSTQDIFDLLNAWFAGNPAADFNASGTITAQDIFDFLNAWFAGC